MKKKIAFVCAAAMLLALLGGCKGDGPVASTPEGNSAVSSSSTTTTTTTTAEDATTTTTTTSATVTGDPTANTTNKPTATASSKSATTTTMAKPTATTTTTTPPTYPTSVGEDFVHNCRLIVNGKDITKGNYVAYWDHEEGAATIALPLFAIMRELGGTIEYSSETEVVMKREDRIYWMDLEKKELYCNMQKWNDGDTKFDMFMVIGRAYYAVKIINGEVVVPHEMMIDFLAAEGVSSYFDYDTMTVEIR